MLQDFAHDNDIEVADRIRQRYFSNITDMYLIEARCRDRRRPLT
jgi:hypothetical protein